LVQYPFNSASTTGLEACITMIRGLKRTISFRNLLYGQPAGQVATLLLLTMMAVLLFILITVNIGQNSLVATNLANAADSSALYLASQLSTKAYQLYHALGDKHEICKKGGFLSTLLAIVLAVIAVILAYPTFGQSLWLIPIAMAAGAAGGTIGAAAQGTDLAQGALQGAIVGAAIGGAAYAAAPAAAGGGNFAPGAAVTGAEVGTGAKVSGIATMAGTVEAEAITIQTAAGAVKAVITGVSASMNAICFAAGVATVTAANVYSEYAAQRMSAKDMGEAVRQLNKLPEYERVRESVFLNALAQVVDDPNMVKDTLDSDADGDTTEEVPAFQPFWQLRTNRIMSINQLYTPRITQFMNTLGEFHDILSAQYSYLVNSYGRIKYGPLVRHEDDPVSASECNTVSATDTIPRYIPKYYKDNSVFPKAEDNTMQCSSWAFCRDGAVVETARGLEATEIFRPGVQFKDYLKAPNVEVDKDKGTVISFDPAIRDPQNECSGDKCDAERFPDEVVAVKNKLEMFVWDVRQLLQEAGEDPEKLLATWHSWIVDFYDPENYEKDQDDNYTYTLRRAAGNGPPLNDNYDVAFWKMINGDGDFKGLKWWKERLIALGDRKPVCIPCPGNDGTTCVSNPPCKAGPSVPAQRDIPGFGARLWVTTDSCPFGELAWAIESIDYLINVLEDFRNKARIFYNTMHNDAIIKDAEAIGYINPMVYTWTDSRGKHDIVIKVKFRMPRLYQTKSGNFLVNEKCTKIADYCANTKYCNFGTDVDRPSVEITRFDHPAVGGKKVGKIGLWNPFSRGKITRKSVAYYDVNKVGLKSTR
jgi:hypothetical protein